MPTPLSVPGPVRRGLTVVLTALAATFAVAGTAASAEGQDSRRSRLAGRVTDAGTGQAVAGATVQVAGTTAAATTGADGRYAIAGGPVGLHAIEVRRLGYGPARIDNVRLVADSTVTVDVRLQSAPLRLQETVISATVDPTSGIKTPFTVDKLTAENIPVPTTTSMAGAIIGKVAGVSIIRASGAPGSGVNLQLRSPVSQLNSNGPLFVVDGVFLNSTQAVTTQDIEALDIAAVEVIKGAAAASLYGSRAAGGVISVTTNRGKALGLGQTQLLVRNEYGFDQFAANSLRKPQAHQYRVNSQGQYVNAQGAVVPRSQRVVQPDGIMENRYIDPLFDHVDQFFRPGRFNAQTITLLQNSAATNLSLSYTRNDQPGLIENSSGYLRQSMRVNVDHRLREGLQVGVSLMHSRALEDPSSVTFSDLYRFNPDVDLRRPEPLGTSRYVIIPDSTETRTNPLYIQDYNDNKTRRARTLGNLTASYRPFDWLSLDGFLSYDRGDRQVTNYIARGLTNTNGEGTTLGQLLVLDDDVDGINAQWGGTVIKPFGRLVARLTARGEIQKESNPFTQSTGSDFTVSGVKDMDLARTKVITSSLTDVRTNAAFTSLALDYDGRFIGDFGYRYEGSSLFGTESRWNGFYRASGAWLLHAERWFPFRSFSAFKARYSIGTAGVRPGFSDRFETLSVDGTGGLSRDALGNRFLKPEISTEQEMGIDAIWKDRVSVSIVRVFNRTEGNLISVPVPAIFGYNTQERNVGSIKGQTTELTVQAQVLNRPGGLQWEVNVVGDRRRNGITAFRRSCYTDGILYRCEGTKLGAMYGNRLVRDKGRLPSVHANSGSAFDINDDGYVVPVGAGNTWRDGKAKNLWGTNVIVDGRSLPWGRPLWEVDPATGQRWFGQIGNGNPDFTFGMGHTLRWRGFRVYGLLNGQIGGDIYNQVKQTLYATNDHPDVDQSNKPDEQRKPTLYYSTAIADGNANYGAPFVEDGTYARLSEFTAGYTFDARNHRWLAPTGVSRLQLDIVGRNLATFTGYSGLNPESGSPLNRIDNTVYPFTRTWTLAATLTF
jgi:TonB-linked SusC/RagA family outer membrane protein